MSYVFIGTIVQAMDNSISRLGAKEGKSGLLEEVEGK